VVCLTEFRTPVQVFRLSIELLKEHFKEEQIRQQDALADENYDIVEEDSIHSMTGAPNVESSFFMFKDGAEPFKSSSIQKWGQMASSSPLLKTQSTGSSRSTLVAAAEKVTSMNDLVMQAEGACDMMSETVSNAIDAARARWSRVEDGEFATSNCSGGFMKACKSSAGGTEHQVVEMEVASLIRDCRRLSVWHHSESVGCTEEIAPEVICTSSWNLNKQYLECIL